MVTSKILDEKSLKRERRFILFIILGISLIGLLLVYEASSIYAFKTTGDPAYFFKRQLIFFFIGLMFFYLTLLIDLEFLREHSKEILFFTIVILIAVVFLGKRTGGAKRWISFGGVSFQPSELLKISFLLYCADYCQRKKNLIKNFPLGLFPLGLVLGFIGVCLLLQPDLGNVIFWIGWLIIYLFIFKARKKHLISAILIGALLFLFLVQLYPYRLRRISAYLNPFSDPQGAGFQLVQSQIAYGIGGIWGLGLGEGIQKLSFLPAAHTDFIFSILAEEFGLWGSLGFLFLFFLLFHKMFNVAKQQTDGFRKGILWGVVLIFTLEIVINIGVSCGIFPTKGLPLPFMSYGGSNLVVHYILLGLYFKASKSVKKARPKL